MALTVFTTEIPADQSLSTALDCRGVRRIVRLGLPGVWDAASLTFQTAVLPVYKTPPADSEYSDLYHVVQAASGVWQTVKLFLHPWLRGPVC